MKNEKKYTISEAAKMAGVTAETLRHYDRIGLVKPCAKDDWTGYRYYSAGEIVRLNTIQALRCMGLSLKEIKKVLEYDSLEKIVQFLKQAEKSADEKMVQLHSAKTKIQRARADYEKKLRGQTEASDSFIQYIEQRAVLLSDTMQVPTLDNLWNYYSHFYKQLASSVRDAFAFEDMAGIYTQGECSRLFVVCSRYAQTQDVRILPAGAYLCANCTGEDRESTLECVKAAAQEQYGAQPGFAVQLIRITGILQWNYQVQIYLGEQ